MPFQAGAGEILNDRPSGETVVKRGGNGRAEAPATVMDLIEDAQGIADRVAGFGEEEVFVTSWRLILREG